MAEKNVGSFIVTVKPAVDKEDVKRVEHEYTEKFKQIGEKCADVMNDRIGFSLLKGGIWASVLTAAMAGISAILDTGFEKASGELDELLAKANEVSATASQFGNNASPYELLVAKSVAAQAGVGPNDLQNMMLKFSIMQANNDPLLKNFHSGDSMQDFFSFINALNTLNPNQSMQAAVKVFGRLDAGKAQTLANSNVNQKIEDVQKGLADNKKFKGLPDGITQSSYDNAVKNANDKYAEQQADKLQNEAFEIIKGSDLLNKKSSDGKSLTQIQADEDLIKLNNKLVDIEKMLVTGNLQNQQDKMRQQMQDILNQVQFKTLPAIERVMGAADTIMSDDKGTIHGYIKYGEKRQPSIDATERKITQDSMQYLKNSSHWYKRVLGTVGDGIAKAQEKSGY